MQELRQLVRDLGGFLLPSTLASVQAPIAAHSRPSVLERPQLMEPSAGNAESGSSLAAAVAQASTGHAELAAARLSRLRQLRDEAAAALPRLQASRPLTVAVPKHCSLLRALLSACRSRYDMLLQKMRTSLLCSHACVSRSATGACGGAAFRQGRCGREATLAA